MRITKAQADTIHAAAVALHSALFEVCECASEEFAMSAGLIDNRDMDPKVTVRALVVGAEFTF